MNIYEQGAGRIHLPNSMNILQEYKPRCKGGQEGQRLINHGGGGTGAH